jgi:hypothetical protein
MQWNNHSSHFVFIFFPLREISSRTALERKKDRILLFTGAQGLRVMPLNDCEPRHCRCCDRHTALRRLNGILPILFEFFFRLWHSSVERLWASWKSADWKPFVMYWRKWLQPFSKPLFSDFLWKSAASYANDAVCILICVKAQSEPLLSLWA